ncbi:MAG: redoxin domain-containing protein, partial [Muribaculaceae bacterium]|nr:redoxin domain-containing protein [Muribaculaceae bacterium]
MASNYYAYPYPANPLPELTPSPQGYIPFHMEHYGRHGSRWHIGKNAYNKPVDLLLPAERNGKLTPRGKELLAQLRKIQNDAQGRDGELTQVGADQHRGIARRMIKNFPEIFSDSARVDARSSVVIRCILSMDNELQELYAANPNLRITSDASAKDMVYIAEEAVEGMDTAYFKAYTNYTKDVLKEFHKNHPDSYEFLKVIVNDEQFAKDSLDSSSLLHYLFNIAANAQSHYDMAAPYDIFTEEEISNRWLYNNARWYLSDGNTRYNGNLQPYTQQNLLRNIIESADTAINHGGNGANMRFGHEVIVLPFASLLELDDFGKEINDLEDVASQWRNHDVFPMGCNIQMIFYHPDNESPAADNVLVKVLLNEKECRLPVSTDKAPYYKWSQLRQYYLDKLAAMPTGRPETPAYGVGSGVDDILGKDIDGKNVSLKKLKGKKIALVFYPNVNPDKSADQMKDVVDNCTKLQEEGYTVVGVSPDSRATLRRIAEEHDLSPVLISDADHRLAEKFGVWDIV